MVRPVVYIEIESRECFSEWDTLVHVCDLSTVHWFWHLVSDQLTHWSNCAILQLLPSPPLILSSPPLPSPLPIQPPAQPTMLTALQMATSPQSLTFIETSLTPSNYSSTIAGSIPQETNPSNLPGGVSTTDSSRFSALKSMVHSVVNSRLEQGVTFSQQPQQTVGKVIVTVKQVFPEYSDSVIHGLIVSELKSNVSKHRLVQVSSALLWLPMTTVVGQTLDLPSSTR